MYYKGTMVANKVPTLPLSSSNDFLLLSLVSTKLKCGAVVPKGNILDGVNDIRVSDLFLSFIAWII